jgi:phosphatidylglycerophosphate synthase
VEYFARWASLHGGYEPSSSRLVGGWLSVVYAVAQPFVRLRVNPDLMTLLGLVVSGLAVWAAGAGWLWVAIVLVVLSGLLDNLDGAVAVLTDRVTAFGQVLDSSVDRLCDGLYLVALWLVGAPGLVCVGAGVAMGLVEYVRARAGAAGMPEVGVVTIFERPTRVIVTAAFLLGAAIYPEHAEGWATAGAWTWLGLGMVALIQLVPVVRRRLR